MEQKEQQEAFKKALKDARVTDDGYGRFTKEDVDWIKATFNNEYAIKRLRKVFLLDYDFNSPIGQANNMWTTLGLEQMSAQDREIHIISQNKLITHIERMISAIWAMTQISNETKAEKAERLAKDSNK